MKWNKKKIINEIKNLNIKDLSDKNMRINNRYLRSAGIKYFGSWNNALLAAEIDPDLVALRKKWNIDILKSEIKQLENLQLSYIKDNNCKLYKSAIRFFGSWANAVQEILHIDYNNIRATKTWNKETVISILKTLPKSKLSYSNVPTDLYKASVRYFGSLKNAINVAGLDYNKIKKVVSWNEKKIIDFIKDRAPNISYAETIEDGYGNILAAAKRYFGSWGNAVEESGFNYKDVIKNTMGHRCFGKDGVLYDSILEKKVGNLLLKYKNNNRINDYFPHKKLCSYRKWTCDFYIIVGEKDLWLEVDGLKEYRPRPSSFDEKIKYYIEHNLNYVILYNSKELENIIRSYECLIS